MDRTVVQTFLQLIFGRTEGLMCIGALTLGDSRRMEEKFFQYPEELDKAVLYAEKKSLTHNMYYCPHLFNRAKRVKDNVVSCPSAWADLDALDPAELLVKPSVLIESSPERYQALWCFDEPQDPYDAEDLSRRIAYYHAPGGADRSGWDLTQFLRIPSTPNYKYQDVEQPIVRIVHATRARYRMSEFEAYPASESDVRVSIPFPRQITQELPDEIFLRYKHIIDPKAKILFSEPPEEDWSGPLWKLQMLCFEAGMTPEEVYVIAEASACNKFKRDERAPIYLWRDVCRSLSKHTEHLNLVVPNVDVESLLTDEERDVITSLEPSFVDRYISWARGLGDAAWQYHQAGAFVALSATLAGSVKLPTSYGTMLPNLWFMILADTTLTRKTTAMDIAMDLVEELAPDTILATDGSIEGMMVGLSTRPGRASIFLRDEFSGLLESIAKKDYMAGMAEMFTKLYDGKLQKRVLKRETIEVKDPVLIVFAGGIKSRVTGLLTSEHISSGFMPRFIFITAESDVNRVKPLGPPTHRDTSGRNAILNELGSLATRYTTKQQLLMIKGKLVNVSPRPYTAELTPAAWERYNKLEHDITVLAMNSQIPELLTPSYDRLAKSGLKAAVLLAASRNFGNGTVVPVEESDILRAVAFVDQWRVYTNEVILNVGKGTNERKLDQIVTNIQRNPGIPRSQLMQRYHLTSRETAELLSTLEDRGVITRQRAGRNERLYPIGGPPK